MQITNSHVTAITHFYQHVLFRCDFEPYGLIMPQGWPRCQILVLCETRKSIDRDLRASHGTFSSDNIKSYIQQEEHN